MANDFGEELKIPQIKIPRPPSGMVGFVIIGMLVLLVAGSTVYTVDPEEIGVVLRFGKFERTTNPGLHAKLPLGIESVRKVKVQRQLKEEFGFRTTGRQGADGRSQYEVRGLDGESNMLTGDLNAAVVEWVVQYRVVDAEKYLFRVRDVRATFRAMSEAVMRQVVGDRTVNEVLTVGRQEIADLVEQKLQELCDQYETGITVDQVVLQDVNPPDPVKPSFNEVNTAQQERERLINGAQSEYNRTVPRAAGEAQQTIQQAEGYALDRVNRAQGDATRFIELFEAYKRAPDITRRRIYIETMGTILPKVKSKTIIDDGLGGVLPLLNLNDGKGGR